MSVVWTAGRIVFDAVETNGELIYLTLNKQMINFAQTCGQKGAAFIEEQGCARLYAEDYIHEWGYFLQILSLGKAF